MKLINFFSLILLLVSIDLYCSNITLRQFGAKADGKADDTWALKRAMIFAQTNHIDIDGEGLKYYVSGNLDLKLSYFSLKNCNFVTSNDYKNQFTLKVDCNQISMSHITFDGGRNTYKDQIEEWEDFSKENNIKSIYPTPGDVFYFVALDENANIDVNNVSMRNVHASSCITVITYGRVNFETMYFENISNKTFHVYHSINEGKYQNGKTYVSNIKSKDVGIIPDRILYKNQIVQNQNLNAMPQASFNFIVSFGEYYLKNAEVINYGSTGVTSDRNKFFQADYIKISNFSNRTFSNNPSGAIWLEATKKATIKRVDINIQNRDLRDLQFDSSAFALYGVDSEVIIDSLTIKGKYINKGFRGSFEGINKIHIKKIMIDGEYKQASALFAMMPNTQIQTQIIIDEMVLNSGVTEFYGIEKVEINSILGVTGKETINFKLPYTLDGREEYSIKPNNLLNIYKSKVIKNLKLPSNSKNKNIIKILN